MRIAKITKPKLHADYKHILRKSWAIKWGALAGAFSGMEVILPLFMNTIPKNMFAILSFIAVVGAIWARLLVQQKDNL